MVATVLRRDAVPNFEFTVADVHRNRGLRRMQQFYPPSSNNVPSCQYWWKVWIFSGIQRPERYHRS